MIKITHQIAHDLAQLGDDDIGFSCEQGTAIGDAHFVIYYPDETHEPYLAHISEFEQNGLFIRVKDKTSIL